MNNGNIKRRSQLRRINRKIRIHKEGRAILISMFVLLVAINLLFHFKTTIGIYLIINLIVSVVMFGFFLYFFRNPERIADINDDSLVIAPADGRIVAIEDVEVYEYFEGKKMKQVSIFMSPFNVHANWSL